MFCIWPRACNYSLSLYLAFIAQCCALCLSTQKDPHAKVSKPEPGEDELLSEAEVDPPVLLNPNFQKPSFKEQLRPTEIRVVAAVCRPS